MDITTMRPTVTSVKTAVAESASRLVFVDHLRAALVTLVVLHHVALVYGAGAPFYYVEPPMESPLAFLMLLVFVLLNQAWFMGAFFFIAGYFTPDSLSRKGPGDFLKGRLLRLGVPLLLYYFVLSPIASIGYWYMPPELTGITDPLTWQAYPFLLGLGPLWFAALLLVFDFGYAGWRMLTQNRAASAPDTASIPSYVQIGGFVLGLALVSYGVRMVIPMGRDVLGFPTLSYLPQYLSFFVLGIVAARRDWFRTLPGSLGVVGVATALLATVLLFPLALSGQLFSLELTEASGFVGNGHWQSAVYALWDSTFAVGLFLGAVTLFRRFLDGRSALGRFLARHSYAVYVIHIPVIVWLAIALRGVELAPLAKFGVAAVIMVPACFVAAYAVRKLPLASRIF